MKTLHPSTAARTAATVVATRPAMSIILDAPDVRLVVFRLAPGQSVAPHRNASTVMLTVLAGEGMLSGGEGERRCTAGEVVVYEPSELHGMRAVEHEVLLLATIAAAGDRAAVATPIARQV